MPGLSFQSQNSRPSPFSAGTRRPGGWLVAVVLVVISIALITLCVRSEGSGPFAAARAGVQTVTKPIERVFSGLSAPLRSLGASPSEELDQLKQENEQLKTLVSELEEYRQQNQRLSALVQLSDTYDLATTSATVLGATSGWSRTATIDVGSNNGIRIGMGVISSCGLYGQIEVVSPDTSTVRLITDSNSSVSAMIQGSRARGVLRGSYDGTLTLDYISTEYTVGEGDFVITSGDGGVYPNGIIIGTVRNAEPDPSKLYYRITVEPIFNPASCQEVMVLTGDEGEVASIVDEELMKTIKDTMLATKTSDVTTAINTVRTGTTETFISGEQAEGQDAASGQQGQASQATSSANSSSASAASAESSADSSAQSSASASSAASGGDDK